MKAATLKLDANTPDDSVIREAADCLRKGGLVAFPTETVYGLGADATNPDALARLREVKERPASKPFTVHIGSRLAVERFVPELDGVAKRLADKAWPGPLTLIFQVADPTVAPVIQDAGQNHVPAIYYNGSVGIRYPDDRTATAVLRQAEVPIVAASANPAGQPPPVDAEEIAEILGNRIDLILDSGRARYAKASTIVRANRDHYEILREGVIDERTVRRLTQVHFLLVCTGNTCRSVMAEGLLRRLLAERLGCEDDELDDRGYHVESAGTVAFGGAPASVEAIEVLKARGIDLRGHRSQALDAARIRRSDYLFAMTASHLRTVEQMVPDFRGVARRLSNEDIDDPIGGSREVYARCAERIETALKSQLEEVSP
jgi:protein-tyrosine phosphatase